MTSRGAFYPQLLWLCDSAMQDECRLIVVYFFSPIVLHYLPNISKHCVQLLSSEMTLQSYLLLRSFLGDNSSLGDHHMMYNIKNLHPQPLTCLFVALCTLKIICSLIVCSHNIVISCRYFVGALLLLLFLTTQNKGIVRNLPSQYSSGFFKYSPLSKLLLWRRVVPVISCNIY